MACFVPSWNIHSTSNEDAFTYVEPFTPGKDLDRLMENSNEMAAFYQCNPFKVKDRKFMVDTATNNGWFLDPDLVIDCGSKDDDHDEYWAFAKAFADNFKFVITFIEGNHRMLVILYTLMGLAPLQNVPLLHESRKENRITRRFLELTSDEMNYTNIKPTEKDEDFLPIIKKMITENNANMLTRYLYVNAYAPTKKSTPAYSAKNMVSATLKNISVQISNNRNHSSEQTNLDQLTDLYQDVATPTDQDWPGSNGQITLFVNGKHVDGNYFSKEFDPIQFPNDFPKLEKFFDNPNLYHLKLKKWIQLLHEVGTTAQSYRGRPPSTFDLTDTTMLKAKMDYLPMWDMLLLYQLLWTNESYFGNGEKIDRAKILAKAYYMAMWIRLHPVFSWKDPSWNKMPQNWRQWVENYDEKINYIGQDNGGGSRPGMATPLGQTNAVTVFHFHMIQACEIGNKPKLLAKVIDRMKTDFGGGCGRKEQLIYISKCSDHVFDNWAHNLLTLKQHILT